MSTAGWILTGVAVYAGYKYLSSPSNQAIVVNPNQPANVVFPATLIKTQGLPPAQAAQLTLVQGARKRMVAGL